MEPIKPIQVFRQRLAISMGMDKYADIMNRVWKTDVSNDLEFQKAFNGFYRVRRNDIWQRYYYSIFESAKTVPTTFEDALVMLYEKTGQIEASFASKMIATLNPDMPIWDQYVIKNLGIKLPLPNDPDRISKTAEIYKQICDWYQNFLKTDNATECIEEFDRMLPDYSWMSKVKKSDFFLWSIR